MGAVPESFAGVMTPAIPSTPSAIATTTSMSSSPPQLSEIDELGYDSMSNDIDADKPLPNGFESETTVSSLTTGISSTEASSPTVSSSMTATGNNMHNMDSSEASGTSSQGRYDNTVNEYDLVKEASRAHIKSRTVCVAIPVNRKDGTVLMVTSRKHDTKWIFPKGGHEKGETYAESAVREAWEEEPEVYIASSMSGDGARQIHYHIFEMEVSPEDLCQEWPESSQRNREFVTIPKALERCAAWANEKNTKLELVIGFRKTRVFREWHEASQQQSTTAVENGVTSSSISHASTSKAPECISATDNSRDADNGDLIENKKRRGVGTEEGGVKETPKLGLLGKVFGFVNSAT
ncbi:hypothetical protein QFC22_000076 [Naganishia vaughanmartiniae]|uniref:Uncharacterized protein n=1 Tax=Naganishia vaughanmartiniae TaxID=1424756 RepID=A0ACC2XMB8_9TREE|nr:hypothetical protein QFC22_000076 [Naganishia vaughanmartiniae]